jgi:hypothetical protein
VAFTRAYFFSSACCGFVAENFLGRSLYIFYRFCERKGHGGSMVESKLSVSTTIRDERGIKQALVAVNWYPKPHRTAASY